MLVLSYRVIGMWFANRKKNVREYLAVQDSKLVNDGDLCRGEVIKYIGWLSKIRSDKCMSRFSLCAIFCYI